MQLASIIKLDEVVNREPKTWGKKVVDGARQHFERNASAWQAVAIIIGAAAATLTLILGLSGVFSRDDVNAAKTAAQVQTINERVTMVTASMQELAKQTQALAAAVGAGPRADQLDVLRQQIASLQAEQGESSKRLNTLEQHDVNHEVRVEQIEKASNTPLTGRGH
jgi:hypothetical protein